MADSNLHIKIAVRLLLFVPFALVLLFVPAGTFDYWEAWLFSAVFFTCNVLLTVYLVVKDPKLLERRMKAGPSAETSTTQKIIVVFVFIFFAGAAVFPALDHRFGWSEVPTAVVILSDVLIALSYYGFIASSERTPTARPLFKLRGKRWSRPVPMPLFATLCTVLR
jgi:hypothetical protein